MKKLLTIFAILFLFSTQLIAQEYNKLVEKSFECIENEDWSCAEDYIIKALKKEPANVQNSLLLSNLGTIQRYMGKNAEAIKSYTNALMITPRSVTILKNRASLYASIDSLDKAISDYSFIVALDSKEQDALYERGLVYLQKQDTLSARCDFEALLKMNPDSRNAYIGFATLMKYRNYYDESIDLYSKVLKLNDKDYDAYFGRAEAYFYIGKMTKAREDIKKALLIDATDPLLYVLRAKVGWSQFEKESAINDLDKAVELGFSRQEADKILEALKSESKKFRR